MRRRGKSRSPIGLDVGRRRVKAVQFHRAGGRWRVAAAASVPRVDNGAEIDPAEVRDLKSRLAEMGFHGARVVLAVPSDRLITGIVELPPVDSGAPIERLARSELARMHKCDPGSLEMAYWELPAPARAGNATFVMGVACTHEDANRFLDAFETEGFDVERLDVQAGAIARVCRPLLRDVRGTAGILDIGWSAARLILMHGETVAYERNLTRSGLAALVLARGAEPAPTEEQVDQLLGPAERQAAGPADGRIGPEARRQYVEGLIDEMRIPLSYLASQYPDSPLERLLLVGGGGRLPGLAKALGPALGCEVRVAGPGELAACPEEIAADHGAELMTALGLAQPDEG